MDKDTKIELLKILGMIIILVVLICGIVWLNKAQDISVNETTSTEETSSTEAETEEDKSSDSDKNEEESSEEKDDNKKDEK